MTTKQKLEEILKDIPSGWRDNLVDILCQIKENKNPDCDKVKECETLTSLSDFSVSGNTISIVYKDEQGISVTRQFSIETILNQTLEGLDPLCLTDLETWQSLSYKDRIQLLIESHCDCCSTSTTTTTTLP